MLQLTYIVPVYNTQPYIRRCLESLLCQGLGDDEYEVIVVDDGSTDGSRDEVEAVAREHRQVQIIEQSNAGVSAARNAGLKAARGQYVQFVDSDDYLQSDMMGTVVRQAIDNEADVLALDFQTINPDGSVVTKSPVLDRGEDRVATGAEHLQRHRMLPYVWSYLISLDYINKLSLRFDTDLMVCEDGAFLAELLLRANRVMHLPVAAYCYVMRNDSIMHTPNSAHRRERINSQIASADSIQRSISDYEQQTGQAAPASVDAVKNIYLFFSMTAALVQGCVRPTVCKMRALGLYPFPALDPQSGYEGSKWKVLHQLMCHPHIWAALSRLYRMIKK